MTKRVLSVILSAMMCASMYTPVHAVEEEPPVSDPETTEVQENNPPAAPEEVTEEEPEVIETETEETPAVTETEEEIEGTEIPEESETTIEENTEQPAEQEETVPAEAPETIEEEPASPEEETEETLGTTEEETVLPEETEETPAEEEEAVLLNAEPFHGEYTLGDLNVTVAYEAGTVPEGTEVVVAEPSAEAVSAIKDKYGEDTLIMAADISFRYNDEEIEPKDYSEQNVNVSLSFRGEDNLSDRMFNTVHVAETTDEAGTVVYSVDPVEAEMTDETDTVQVPVYETREIMTTQSVPYEESWTETVTVYKDVDVYEDVQVPYEEEVPVYETRDITEERTSYVTKTRPVEKTRTVKVKAPFKWYNPLTWFGYTYVEETYTVYEEYKEPVTETVVVGTEEVQVGTETVTKYRTEKQYVRTDTVPAGTEEVVHTETKYRDETVGTGEYEEVATGEYTDETIVVGQTTSFAAKDFSVYAVVATAFANNGQYVVYTGTTALAYTGQTVTTAPITVEGTVVRSNSDNIVWTLLGQGGTWKLYSGSRYLQYQRSNGNDNLRTTSGQNNDGTNWTYNNTYHVLYATNGNRTRYLAYNNGVWSLTQNYNQAATVYIAQVQNEPATGDLTYNYYKADHTASISVAEIVAEADYTTTWTDVADLAKEIDGYTFLEARANSVEGDVITQVNGRAYRQGTETSGNGHVLNSIYFIYMKNFVPGEDDIPDLKGPETEKNVTHNSDGTFTIQLNITGVTNSVKHGANVVVVLDTTSSMNGNMSGTDTTKRIDAAISAVNTMVTTLNPGDPTQEGYNDIDFALVEFNRSADAYDFGSDGIAGHTNWTKSGTALNNRVGRYANGANLPAAGGTTGGTNWQAALQEAAAVLENKPDSDPTYVIFMTDGEPSIYIGSETITNSATVTLTSPEYARALPYATAIVNADYHMYDIFCSAGANVVIQGKDLLEHLKDSSGAESYVKAETTTAIQQAFAAVAQAMLDAIGSSNVAADDGVPSLGSFDLSTVEGEVSNVRYYKNGELWADAPEAVESAAGVKWDLTSEGTLANGTVYTIEFEVWPSQAAYDLIADLNNGKVTMTDAELDAAGIAKSGTEGNYSYTLKTNTSLNTTYTLYGTTHSDPVDFTSDAMDLPTEPISVKKLWPENMLDEYGAAVYRDPETGESKTAIEIQLTLMRDGDRYLDILVKGSEGWKKDDIYVSNGFMTVETVDGNKVAHIKETGHDYQLVEPPAFMYYWDLVSDVYHPMVINGEATILIYDIDKTEADVDNETYFAIGTNADGTARIYKKSSSASNNTLEGSNYRRSNLNLTKKITSGDPDSLFTFTAKVTDSYSTDGYVWFSVWDPAIGGLNHDIEVTGGNATKETKDIPEGATIDEEAGTCTFINDDDEEETHPIAGEGKYYTGYYYATNGAVLTIKLKADWGLRFLNIYHGSTFSFEETEMPGNFVFKSIAATTQYAFLHDVNADWYEIDTENTDLVTGTITEPNNNYTVTYTNEPKPEFYIYHSGVAGDGNLEVIPMSDVNEDGTYNLYAKTTEGLLYGGYYLDYAGKGDYKDDGVKGTTGVAYTGMNYDWTDPQTVVGTAMKPKAGVTYYIKEVPTYYLRNYHQIIYMKTDGKLTGLYLLSALDDLNYNEAGFTLQSEDGKQATVVQTFTVTSSTGNALTLKANTVFKSRGITGEGSENEYLTYWNVTGSEYFAPGTFTVLPYWITPDGITTDGVSTRTITIASMTKAGISKSDQ